MTDIYLALGSTSWAAFFEGVDVREVRALVSFAMPAVIKSVEGMPFKALMLDSGAFTAHNTGSSIDMDELICESKKAHYTESVALDVIGNGPASLENARKMQQAGSSAFPVFHIGEPLELLAAYCAEFPKVGLSCRFGEPPTQSMRWLDACFNQQWPHKFHSFGWTAPRMLNTFPFHSADSSTWSSLQRFGRRIVNFHPPYTFVSAYFRQVKFEKKISAAPTVAAFGAMERYLKARWRTEMESLT